MVSDSEKVCNHFKFGHCRFMEKCTKKHINEVCNIADCNTSSCDKRHPKICRYFVHFNRCKFGSFCNYLHMPPLATVLKSQEVKIRSLETELLQMKQEKIGLECSSSKLAQQFSTLENTFNSNFSFYAQTYIPFFI